LICRRPVAVTIQQRADDAATQHSGERFLISFGFESGDNLLTLGKAADVQTFLVRGPTAETRHVRRVSFLNTLVHGQFVRFGNGRMRIE
jgi:hypothetical protein